jgi:hypothetical protein
MHSIAKWVYQFDSYSRVPASCLYEIPSAAKRVLPSVLQNDEMMLLRACVWSMLGNKEDNEHCAKFVHKMRRNVCERDHSNFTCVQYQRLYLLLLQEQDWESD